MNQAQNVISFWTFQHVEDLDSDVQVYDVLCSSWWRQYVCLHSDHPIRLHSITSWKAQIAGS
jgi:hypothetical protein